MSLDFTLYDRGRYGRYELFTANITHNLNAMAGEAGVYAALWRPDEAGFQKAGELIDPLTKGLAMLRSDPERFRKLNPPNGWGNYDGLVNFVDRVRDACETYPEAEIGCSR